MAGGKRLFQNGIALTLYLALSQLAGASLPTSLQWDQLKPEIKFELSRLLDNGHVNSWVLEAFKSQDLNATCSLHNHYPKFYFEAALGPEERVQLLGAFVKLDAENFLPLIQTINWAGGKGGVVVFQPSVTPEKFKQILEQVGYVSRFHAATSEDLWGLRSPRKGAQLHFRGAKDGQISVHIDLHNPAIESAEDWRLFTLGQQMLDHVVLDWWEREDTHGAEQIKRAIWSQGLIW